MKRFIMLSLMVLVAAISSVSGQELRPKVAIDYFANKSGYSFTVNDQKLDIAHYRTRLGLDFTGTFSKDDLVFKEFRYTAFIDNHFYMDNIGGLKFNPRIVNFYIGASLSYKRFKVEYTHLCVHPTKTERRKSFDIYGGYDMISLSYGY